MKIAIVYDWIDKWGGVERVLLTLHEMFPKAEFFTSYYDPEKAPWAKDLNIKTSFIQKLPPFIRGNRIVSLPFYPYAFESFDFTDYDLVISVSSSFAKSIITKPETKHICYLLTPTRFLWVRPELYLNKSFNILLSPYLAKLREWDYIAAQRPDQIISISHTVADRCKKFYKRDSEVIYPPFDIEYWDKIKSKLQNLNFKSNPKFKFLQKQKFFLIVSRLEPYKRVDLVIPSFIDRYQDGKTDSKYQLIIVGEGSQLAKLKQMTNKNITFLAKLTDHELGYLYSNAEALIMPQEEDFGYVSLEAQFFACPVIAYKKGGAIESVVDGKTGMFFREQSEKSLSTALNKFDMLKYELKQNVLEFGQRNVEKFNKSKFIATFKEKLM